MRKAIGPDGILVDVWKCLDEMVVVFLNRLFSEIQESETTPEESEQGCSTKL